jgi:hypothetical protein
MCARLQLHNAQAQQLLNQTDWPERLINPEGMPERSTRNSVLSRIQVRCSMGWGVTHCVYVQQCLMQLWFSLSARY